MHYIVIFATTWGYKHGGINAFNYDFCLALGQCIDKNNLPVELICFSLTDPSGKDNTAANANNIRIESLNGKGKEDFYHHYSEIKHVLATLKSDNSQLVFIGHDVFSGTIANQLRDDYTGSNAIIFHHMDYSAYAAMKDLNPEVLQEKVEAQECVLGDASFVIAIGPKLLESAKGKTAKPILELIPGLHKINNWPHILTKFSPIIFGRYDPLTDNLKQMKLAAKAFADFVITYPSEAGQDPTLFVTGINTVNEAQKFKEAALNPNEQYINIYPQPYNTTNRDKLFVDLSKTSVCLVLSVHEGFGLTGLEAIASGVPLILSRNTGLYNWLISLIPVPKLIGYGIQTLDIKGSNDTTVNADDTKAVIQALREVRKNQESFVNGIRELKSLLLEKYTWQDSATHFVEIINERLSINITDEDRTPIAPQIIEQQLEVPSVNTTINPSYTAFIGRKKDIEKTLNIIGTIGSSKLLIHGTSGAGKTSLALRLVELLTANDAANQRAFGAYLWIPARTHIVTRGAIRSEVGCSTLAEVLSKIAIGLRLVEVLRNSAQEQENLIIDALNTKKALLIFDNFEVVHDDKILHFINKLGSGNFVIITSRDDIPEIRPSRHLRNMIKEDSSDLIDFEKSNRNINLSKSQKNKIQQVTGGIPLAIRWCMVNLESSGNIDIALEIMEKDDKELLEFCFAESVESLDEIGKNILIASSLFPGTATYEQLRGVSASADAVTFEKAIIQLRNKSLIEMTDDRFYILPLTKRLVVASLTLDKQYYQLCESRLFDTILNYLTLNAPVIWTTGIKSTIWYDEAENVIETINSFREKGYNDWVVELAINIYPFILLYGQWDYYRRLCISCLAVSNITPILRIQLLSRLTAIIVHSNDNDQANQLIVELDAQQNFIKDLPHSDVNLYHFIKTVHAVNHPSADTEERIKASLEYEKEFGNEWAVVGFMGWQGIFECAQNRFKEAKNTVSEAIIIAKKLELYRSLTFLYPIYLQAFNNDVKNSEDIDYPIDEMVNLASDFSELHNMAHLYKEIGILYKNKGEPTSDDYLQTAQHIYQQLGLAIKVNECEKLLKL